jgi:hypothetical protein
VAGLVVEHLGTMTTPTEDDDIAVHLNPVRRERADFIIRAEIKEPGVARDFEQLWARRLAGVRFEICCIPFFVYDLALGDEVETAPHPDYTVQRVVRASGRYTFRAWFGGPGDPGQREEAISALTALASEAEWYSENLLALDAVDGVRAQALADLLAEHESRGALTYETGRTR